MSDRELWDNIDAYQVKADAAGYGESWLQMRQERTLKAAGTARRAAKNAQLAAADAVFMVDRAIDALMRG